jgi:hypothetical protein
MADWKHLEATLMDKNCHRQEINGMWWLASYSLQPFVRC